LLLSICWLQKQIRA